MAERRTLDRLLSRLGLCSRVVAAGWIAEGRVAVNGRVVRAPGAWVDPRADAVTLDGRPVRAAPPVVVALNKPRGFVTTRRDPRGRRTIYELLRGAPGWVGPVGRLDRDTSGLLLLTNDTDLAERVTNPDFGLVKRYRATTRARIDEAALAELCRGVRLDDGPTRPARAHLVGHRGPTSVVELEIHEGRKHQVRRMFLAVGRPLKELRRTAVGPIELGELASGSWRVLAAEEVRALWKAVGE